MTSFDNPTAALDEAAALTAAGDAAWHSWVRVLDEISVTHARQPWGDDEAGAEFNLNYLSGTASAAQLLATLAEVMPLLRGLGRDVTGAINGTVDTDELIAKWFATGSG